MSPARQVSPRPPVIRSGVPFAPNAERTSAVGGELDTLRRNLEWVVAQTCTMSANREKCPWNATVIVRVGPFLCLATMRSASPARGLSRS